MIGGSSVRALRTSLSLFLFGAGCANVLGIGSSEAAAECVSASDCAVGFDCVDFRCTCVRDCENGGSGGDATGGVGGTGTSGGTHPSGQSGSDGDAGGEGGSTSVSGRGGRGRGGSNGAASGAAGNDAGLGGSGNAGGMTPLAPGGKNGAGDGGASDGGAGDGGAGDGGAGDGGANHSEGECDPTKKQCLLCNEETHEYEPGTRCLAACDTNAVCFTPWSCDALMSACSEDKLSCCLSYPVSGGDFLRSCDEECQDCEDNPDHIYPASIAAFGLDAFEVTVGRFRRFVTQYEAVKPSGGAGKNPNNKDDSGWDPAWTALIPGTQQDLRDALASTVRCAAPISWTNSEGANEFLPMNCVTWLEAQAFCIYDDGRLPTEAEWNYAAVGGAEQRLYPWLKPPSSDPIEEFHAIYKWNEEPPTGPAPVGSRPQGRGRWNHYDLLGNVAEWTWDGRSDCYFSPSECDNCGRYFSDNAVRGGSYLDDDIDLSAALRRVAAGTSAKPYIGFRCARDL